MFTVNLSDLVVVSDLQESESWVEVECDDEFTNIRLAMSRTLGIPEPVLYDDESVYEEGGEDWDRALDDVIEIQERMSKGMKMIEECNDVLSSARAGERIPYDAYCAWVERVKKLWAQWHHLRECCAEQIGEDRWLWNKYFSLAGVQVDRAGYTSDDTECPQWVEKIDTMEQWYNDSVDDYQE